MRLATPSRVAKRSYQECGTERIFIVLVGRLSISGSGENTEKEAGKFSG
jgi:hypothetical protein